MTLKFSDPELLMFYFEIVINFQEVAKRGQSGSVYPSPSFPNGYFLQN